MKKVPNGTTWTLSSATRRKRFYPKFRNNTCDSNPTFAQHTKNCAKYLLLEKLTEKKSYYVVYRVYLPKPISFVISASQPKHVYIVTRISMVTRVWRTVRPGTMHVKGFTRAQRTEQRPAWKTIMERIAKLTVNLPTMNQDIIAVELTVKWFA